ncbi:MAG: OPT family oligopeptide transporter [Halieaceae bacterium]|jgi:putative OPT family oligopeptide transporter|nr:OPT family oligopeptide transporter [Halieaceae bacterium]
MQTVTARPPEKRRELTPRAILTGICLGAVLTPCNVYAGLKIGWSFNMSITALLLGFLLWRLLLRVGNGQPWEILESNISQTTASSAASIISGGLVAPIPALALVSGVSLAPGPLMAWVFAVSFLGVWVAWYLRTPLLYRSGLPYPAGTVTAEAMLDLFAEGRAAMQRVTVLLSAAALSAAVKLSDSLFWAIPRWSPGALPAKLTFTLDPSLLLTGFGAIIGLRAGLSLLAGALLAWAGLGPWLIASGQVVADPGQATLFVPLVEWLLWPGVALMVAATISNLLASLVRNRRRRTVPAAAPVTDAHRLTRLSALCLAAVLVVVLEIVLFDIAPGAALLAIPMAFFLAAVVGRVVGETGIPPIGAVGKLSQLSFAVIAPAQATTNLMTANVAGGAAGQTADLLNDFKCGTLVGASPARQVAAQCFGIATGSVIGSLVYLALIPDPQAMLLSAEWPAPAVATWKAVADILMAGPGAIPPAALVAALIAAVLGGVLGVLEAVVAHALLRFVPSASALGLAFVIPASTSLGLFYGALLAFLLARVFRKWSAAYLVAGAAGLVAGESLMGVFLAALSMVA